MKSNRGLRLTLAQRERVTGIAFALPFVIGFIAFFLRPMLQSLVFGFNELEVLAGGYNLTGVGFQNFRKAVLEHPEFNRVLLETCLRVVSDVPLVLMFSFFMASLLNQKFRGRLFARTLFFLPVIMGSGVIASMEQTDYMTAVLQTSSDSGISGGFLGAAALRSFIGSMKLPEQFLTYIVAAVDRIPHVIRASGIQILIFLAGLQSIPPSLYEASTIEGATGWESFWRITFPMMSPLILTNIVYTIVDSFTAADNELLTLIRETAFGGMGFGVSSAMSWIYFAAVSLILLAMAGSTSRWVIYYE
jgi:ABC-type sugar transport system permease subunit